MSAKSTIEWTDATWNPVTGCTKVSQGCKNCYAETWANRKMGEFSKDKNRGFKDIVLHEDKLEIPLRWRKPRKIFVNSMSDLFHKDIPEHFIDKVFAIMILSPRHTFQILTKRPERMKEYFDKGRERLVVDWINASYEMGLADKNDDPDIAACQIFNSVKRKYPFQNIWLGVSVEDQKTADERIPILLQVPAAVSWISAEPLLGEINLKKKWMQIMSEGQFLNDVECGIKPEILDWVVVGGESGHKARLMHPDWVRRIKADCDSAKVPFFFKQWGEWVDPTQIPDYDYHIKYAEKIEINNRNYYKLGKSVSKNFIDGKQYLEMPITLN